MYRYFGKLLLTESQRVIWGPNGRLNIDNINFHDYPGSQADHSKNSPL